MAMLRSSLFSERAGRCELCKDRMKGSSNLVCLECGRHFCTAVGSIVYPWGHSRQHANEEQHWVAALLDDPESAFCFKCDCVVGGPRDAISGVMDEAEASSGGSSEWDEPCSHVPNDSVHMNRLRSSLLPENEGKCVRCKGPVLLKSSDVMVCMECGDLFCTGQGSKDNPLGHAFLHAKQKEHWVAAQYDEPENAYCFKCSYVVCIEPDDGGTVVDEVDHELTDVHRDVVQDLANVAARLFAKPGYIGGVPNIQRIPNIRGHGYAIRGIPNIGFTCYMNAIIQCLLVLDKLRARMLGPDAPSGLLFNSLRDLFVETSAAGVGELDPRRLHLCLCLYDSKFKGHALHDSHELLNCLRNCLNASEGKPYDLNGQRDPPTIMDSIFGFELPETRHCKCGQSSVKDCFYYDLTLYLASNARPAKSSTPASSSVNPKSRQNIIDGQPFPANEQSNLEKIQTVAESGDSHLIGSELKDEVMEETPKPLEVDYTETQRNDQSKDIVHGPLQTQEDKASCFEVPGVKVDKVKETTADSIVSVEDCIERNFKEFIVWQCDNCSKVRNEQSTNQSKTEEQMVASTIENTSVDGDKTEQPDRTTCQIEQSSGSNNLSVECKSSSSRQPHGSDAQSQIMQTVDSVTGGTNVEDDQQKALQTRRFTKLPPVLTLHIARTTVFKEKNSEPVRYQEYLDLRPFIDPSSLDKDNFMYRLVGVVQHIGAISLEAGHYVAYVRARSLGDDQKQSSCSHSWFRADDSTISEISLEEVLKREAYLLFYERMEG